MDQLLDQFSTPEPSGRGGRDFRWARAGGDGSGRCRGCGRKIRRAGSRAGISGFGRSDRIRRRADDRSRAAARAERWLRAAVARARASAPRLGAHRESLSRAHESARARSSSASRAAWWSISACALFCPPRRSSCVPCTISKAGKTGDRSSHPEAESQARQHRREPPRDSGRRAKGQARGAGLDAQRKAPSSPGT